MDKNLILLESTISSILLRMGATPNLSGYRYLKEAIIITLMKHGKIDSIMKDLYGVIAENNKVPVQRVERNIRHTVNIIWDIGKSEDIKSTLGVSDFGKHEKPTSGQFIILFAEKMSREFYYDHEGEWIHLI